MVVLALPGSAREGALCFAGGPAGSTGVASRGCPVNPPEASSLSMMQEARQQGANFCAQTWLSGRSIHFPCCTPGSHYCLCHWGWLVSLADVPTAGHCSENSSSDNRRPILGTCACQVLLGARHRADIAGWDSGPALGSPEPYMCRVPKSRQLENSAYFTHTHTQETSYRKHSHLGSLGQW